MTEKEELLARIASLEARLAALEGRVGDLDRRYGPYIPYPITTPIGGCPVQWTITSLSGGAMGRQQ